MKIVGSSALLLLLAAVGCGKMEQQKPPSDAASGLDDASMDLGEAAPQPKEAAEPAPEPEPEVDQRTQCCQACVAGVEKDTTGDPPGALNCASLDVGSACVLFFDKNPMTGKEAKACIAENAGGDEGGGGGPAAGE